MAAPTPDTNGQQTALIIYRIGQLEKTQEKRFDAIENKIDSQSEKYDDKLEKINDRVGCLEESSKQIDVNTKEIDTLRSSSSLWDKVLAVMAVVGAALGIGVK